MLATCDAQGQVDGSLPGFASLCRISLDQMRECEAKLMSPDPESRTKTDEGRRIVRINGGWQIVNYTAYRERGQDKNGSRAAYMRIYRNTLHSTVTRNTEAEAEAEADPIQCPPPSLSTHEVELPANFPKTEAEARVHAAFIGCPAEFATKMWNKACSRGGRDAKDVPLRNFRAYLAIEWSYERERQAKNGSTPDRQETNEERNARILRDAL